MDQGSGGAGRIAMMVSVGTGKREAQSRFGFIAMFNWARRCITETETAHQNTLHRADGTDTRYFRFDVRPVSGIHRGLSCIKLDECKKADRRSAPEPTDDPVLQEMDVQNEDRAREDRRGGYKPYKYEYTTFQRIKSMTDDYCRSSTWPFDGQDLPPQNVNEEIDTCAQILVDVSRKRRIDDHRRWDRFRMHPDPEHEASRSGLTA